MSGFAEWERMLVVGAIIHRDGRVLAARRSGPGATAGFWEFPGGKVEPGEEPTAALRRELREELAIDVEVEAELDSGNGPWPINEAMDLRVWFCQLSDECDPLVGEAHDEVRWLLPADLVALDWLPADRPIAELVAAVASRS